jgi:hypothetical protein
MHLTLDLEELNIFVMLYIKSIITNELDYKKGIFKSIKESGNSEAILLYEDRELNIKNGKWDSSRDIIFNDQIHTLLPSINIKSLNEFDDFIGIINDRNLSTWLLQRFYRQSPKMRLYIKRFIDKIEGSNDTTIRIIL